ncbi:DUF2336 domain-containing protein [Caenispirillum bisanense]|uniref:Uncharacterized conserved protein, DUF2336 family n=1 Tax=Caenispirillum bisanense TaxID=414052 RepID=A0A286G906_9PROT|nr:DUF2336 domain-containing protein [Caenispirillum bisanense]SOD92057.1 Uncharacterized conserved protein, DUF2336 family [Caenispirillum bisanense]
MSSQEGVIDEAALLRLAREKSADARARLAATISDLFVEQGSVLSDRERALMADILRRILREIEISVRRQVAQALASQENLPRDLMVFLANDEIEVAFPILRESRVLQDADLIEVIRNRTQEHQLAIANRYYVSAAVCDALVQTGRQEVIRQLLQNGDATISEATMEYLVEQSRRVDSFQEPILRRAELPEDLAKRMFLWVSAALRTYVVDRFRLPPSVIDDLMEQAAREGIARTVEEGRTRPSEKLAERLARHRAITPELLISALHDGEVSLFVSLLARLAEMREPLVKRMLFEPGGEGLAITCRAMGFPRKDFSVIFLLSRKARPENARTFKQDHEAAMAFFDRIVPSAAQNVLRQWQRDQDYLKALREVQLGPVGGGQ